MDLPYFSDLKSLKLPCKVTNTVCWMSHKRSSLLFTGTLMQMSYWCVYLSTDAGMSGQQQAFIGDTRYCGLNNTNLNLNNTKDILQSEKGFKNLITRVGKHLHIFQFYCYPFISILCLFLLLFISKAPDLFLIYYFLFLFCIATRLVFYFAFKRCKTSWVS